MNVIEVEVCSLQSLFKVSGFQGRLKWNFWQILATLNFVEKLLNRVEPAESYFHKWIDYMVSFDK